MYVCLCNGYTDRDIRAVVREGGVRSAEEAYMALGGTFCCRGCEDCANSVVEEELPNQQLLAAE